MTHFDEKKDKICIVGLGYVGLPLAIAFAKKFNVIGFDINQKRIEELKNFYDSTKEIDSEILKTIKIEYTNNSDDISKAKLIIITVPTPVDNYKIPDLTAVKNATETVAKRIQKGSVIVYESTVYPGVTEEICIPIIEKISCLKWKKDFFVGYSPERINPGDKEHTVEKIRKIVSGDTKETLELLTFVYSSVIEAGIYPVSSIKVAEAAKVIENIQRDLNIALVNELSIIFHKLNIDTKEVLNAAATKWNFLRFEPGLVGGHCIGVDPYYLTFKAEAIGYHPQVILAGRRINDQMGKYVAENAIKLLIKAGKAVSGCKVLILGLTFKENISDIRNTKIIDIYNELIEYGVGPYIYDPHADKELAKEEYGVELIDDPLRHSPYDQIILAVKHSYFLRNYNVEFYKSISKDNKLILLDVKGVYDKETIIKENGIYWRL